MLELNEAQSIAASHGDGPMMVLAGPGSGKTTVIMQRVKCLIERHGVNPAKILVLSYTKASAAEVKERFLELNCRNGELVTHCTFHALFYRILRLKWQIGMDNLMTEEKKSEAVKEITKSMGLSLEYEALQNLCQEISFVKGDLANPAKFKSETVKSFHLAYRQYESLKEEKGLWDYDDMLVKCLELFQGDPRTLREWQERHPYILIDEFQDINKAQYLCIKLLAGNRANLFIVGDDDQSVYRFRGARPEFLLSFPNDFPEAKICLLNVNYRSTKEIIGVSNEIIGLNSMRHPKEMAGTGKTGMKPQLLSFADSNAEALEIGKLIKGLHNRGTPWHEMAVLYRASINVRPFYDAFMSLGIPFQSKDGVLSIYEHWVCKDITAYLLLAQGKRDSELYSRIIHKPARYITNVAVAAAKKGGDFCSNLQSQGILKNYQLKNLSALMDDIKTLSKLKTADAISCIREEVGYGAYLEEYCRYKGISPAFHFEILSELEEAARAYPKLPAFTVHLDEAVKEAREQSKQKRYSQLERTDSVLLSTLHSAKGLEFSAVFVTGAVEGSIPHKKSSESQADLEEERRLLYVGITRAKSQLFITMPETRHSKPSTASRFLSAILGNNKERTPSLESPRVH